MLRYMIVPVIEYRNCRNPGTLIMSQKWIPYPFFFESPYNKCINLWFCR